MSPTLTRALEYARTHGTTLTETARALDISLVTLEGLASKARRAGHVVEFAKRTPARVIMPPLLQRALEYSRQHGTTMTETAIAMGISSYAINSASKRARKAGAKFEWARSGSTKAVQSQAPSPPKTPEPRASTDPSDVPLDIVRHVRNGTPFWQEVRPMGDPRRGPSRPVMPAPSNAAERPWTAAGLASALDKRPALVDLARRFYGFPVHMTDAEAHALTAALDQK